MIISITHTTSDYQQVHAFTLIEMLVVSLVVSLAVTGITMGYSMAARRAEWSAYSLAAQSLASQRIEQSRAAKWDPLASPPVDELVATNFLEQVDVLDIPMFGTNQVYATIYTTINDLSDNQKSMKMIQVDAVWMFVDRGPFTNSVVTYRAPDQ